MVQLLRRDTDNRALSLHFFSFHVFQFLCFLTSFLSHIYSNKVVVLYHTLESVLVKDTKWTTTLPFFSNFFASTFSLSAHCLPLDSKLWFPWAKSCLCLPMVIFYPQHLVMPGTEQVLSKYSLSQWQNEFIKIKEEENASKNVKITRRIKLRLKRTRT